MFKIVSLLPIIIVVALFWPGYMSPDSLDQYNQSITNKYHDHHPAIMAYWWHYLNMLYQGPQIMLLFNSMVFYLAINIFIDKTNSVLRKALIASVPIMPWIFNFFGVIWKDVTFSFCLLLIVALTLEKISWYNLLLLSILLFFTIGLRHNGVLTVIPIVFLWLRDNLNYNRITSSLLTVLTVLIFYIIHKIFVTEIISPIPNQQYEEIILYDIGYVSLIKNVSFINNVSLDQIKSCLIKNNQPIAPFQAAWCLRDSLSLHSGLGLSTNHDWNDILVFYLFNISEVLFVHLQNFVSFVKFPFAQPSYVWQDGIETNNFAIVTSHALQKINKVYVLGFVKIASFMFTPITYLFIDLYAVYWEYRNNKLAGSLHILPISSIVSICSLIVYAPAADFRFAYYGVCSTTLWCILRIRLEFSKNNNSYHLLGGRWLLMIGDLVAGTGGMLAATWLRDQWNDGGNAPVAVWALVLIAIQVVVARATDAHDLGRASNAFSGTYDAARAWLVAILIYLAVPYWSAPLLSSRFSVVQVVALGLVATIAWRVAYATLARQPRQVMRYAILGGGLAAEAMADAIRAHLGPGHVVSGYLDLGAAADGVGGDRTPRNGLPATPTLPRLGGIEAVSRLVLSGDLATLVVVDGGALAPDLQRHVIAAYEAGVDVVPMPLLYEGVTGRVPVAHAADFWATILPGTGRNWDYRLASRGRDIVIAIVGLAVTAIIVPFVAVAMRLHGPGPLFYRQVRLGRNGRPFTIWKFRSMVPDAEANGGAQWARPGDARVPTVGRLLRASRLDEFPQFWNVLRGEMSVVGPRPERPELVNRLEAAVPFYRVRLAVLPGLTGWAQVRAPYAVSEAETLVKFEYDLYYLRHQSLYLDLLIMVKTLGVVARFRGR